MSRLTYFGHEIAKGGINPSEEKVAAIQNATAPKNASEARSFMGLVQYLARFTPDLSSVGEPIQKLTHTGVTFEWGRGQQTAFEDLKRRITNAETLVYFDGDWQKRIVVDASPVGLGAMLTQLQGGEWRVVSYAPRSLTDVERRYNQTERH